MLDKRAFVLILVLYGIFSTISVLAYRHSINPDGVAEIRLAGYLAEGHFMRSVTKTWSPLFIWSMVPFMAMGLNGLITARMTIALWGAILLITSALLIRRFELSKRSGVIVLLILALLISYWSIRNIGADLPFATMLLFYMYMSTHPGVLTNKKIPFLCGITGGFSYLAHHYAFPFFMAHYPLILILRGYFDRGKQKGRIGNILKSFVIGGLGFLLISSIWIGIVSMKYGIFSVSNKGSIAHSAVGPKGTGHPFFKGGLYKPRDSYALHVFEDPSEVRFNTWSPFENKEYFFYQIGLINMNINYIFDHFIRSSPFFTYPFMIGTLCILVFILLITPLDNYKKFLSFWFIVTFLVYSSGFILILARSPRRFYVLMVLLVIFSFSIFDEFAKFFTEKMGNGWRRKLIILYGLIIFILAFSLKPTIHLIKTFNNVVTLDYVNPYEDIAEQIKQIDFPSPVAFIRSSQKGHTDLYLAYFLNKQLLGRPISKDVDGITEELRVAGGRSILIFDNLDIVDRFKADGRYTHLATIKLREDERYWNAPNIEQDEIKAWDKEVSIFYLEY